MKYQLLSANAPLWDLAFRPFFLLASGLSVMAILAWSLILNGSIIWQSQMPSTLWHIHEMLFGFALTIAVGFLLTAVQTWTNLRSLNGRWLMALITIWLAIRGLLLVEFATPWLVIALQISWWLIVIVKFSQLLLKAKSQRNYKIVFVLSIIASLHIVFLYFAFYGSTSSANNGLNSYELALHLARSAILFFGVIMGLIAGRVVPMFTRNGVNRDGDQKAKVLVAKIIKPTETLDKALVYLSTLGAALFLLNGLSVNTAWSITENLGISPIGFLILVGALHAYRLIRWAPAATVKIPLLWSLHLSYLFLAIGLILVGLSAYVDSIRLSDALHLITVGSIGGMILAMISRVSLGHTGRVLSVGKLMSLAFGLIFLAALVRFVLLLANQPLLAWQVSSFLWAIAFGIFCYRYFPILTRARH